LPRFTTKYGRRDRWKVVRDEHAIQVIAFGERLVRFHTMPPIDDDPILLGVELVDRQQLTSALVRDEGFDVVEVEATCRIRREPSCDRMWRASDVEE
jgi:hypothetical protein